MKPVDVCLVTKNGATTIGGISHIPVHDLIVETSRPLGLARRKAISKVSTEWFAFIDDDVEVGPEWFKEVSSQIEPDVGAVEGLLFNYGSHPDLMRNRNRIAGSAKVTDLRVGDRGKTHNVLIRTDLVKDWNPSRPDLEAYEDWELTQHILKKGYKWRRIQKYLGRHYKTSGHYLRNYRWNVKGYVIAFGCRKAFLHYLHCLARIPNIILSPDFPPFLKKFFLKAYTLQFLEFLRCITVWMLEK